MHNKPGFEPLDSRTYSGKIIDQVIKVIGDAEKTNLSDTDFLPDNPDKQAMEWHIRIPYNLGDTVVLLGKWVQKHFHVYPGLKIVKAPHPAAPQYRGRLNDYIAIIESQISK